MMRSAPANSGVSVTTRIESDLRCCEETKDKFLIDSGMEVNLASYWTDGGQQQIPAHRLLREGCRS